jgi:hypothetical protein
VISVGGPTLHFSGGTFTSETGWSGSGGGCSLYETATSAQAGFGQYGQVNCAGKRATPDVSLDADPASGVSVYDSTRYQGAEGLVYGRDQRVVADVGRPVGGGPAWSWTPATSTATTSPSVTSPWATTASPVWSATTW